MYVYAFTYALLTCMQIAQFKLNGIYFTESKRIIPKPQLHNNNNNKYLEDGTIAEILVAVATDSNNMK